MEQQSGGNTGRGHEIPGPFEHDRFDSDFGADHPWTRAEHDEYQARSERNRKHAAWRMEMARRLRNSGHRPARPDSAF